MRNLVALSFLVSSAWAQEAPKPTPAPDVAPHFGMVKGGLIVSACEREKTCGCSKGLPPCIDMLNKAGLSMPQLACLSSAACDVFCEHENAGQPGTKLHTQCLTPAAEKTAATRFKETATEAACAAMKRCGCEKRAPDECAKSVIKDTPKVDGSFFLCIASQPCADLCDPNGTKPGGGINTRCMQPHHQAATALTQQTIDMMGKMSAEMQQRMHRTTMGIINNMAPTPTRTRVYDAQGNFIREE